MARIPNEAYHRFLMKGVIGNVRVVIELEPVQVELIEGPMLHIDTDIQLNLIGSLC